MRELTLQELQFVQGGMQDESLWFIVGMGATGFLLTLMLSVSYFPLQTPISHMKVATGGFVAGLILGPVLLGD